MFYCETCRFVNSWPTSVFSSGGTCEICGFSSRCYDMSASRLPKVPPVRQVMMAAQDDSGFILRDFRAQKTMRVAKVVQRTDKLAVLHVAPGDVIDPSADPIMFGSVAVDDRFVVRILWDNQLWRPYESDIADLLTSISRPKRP